MNRIGKKIIKMNQNNGPSFLYFPINPKIKSNINDIVVTNDIIMI